MSNLIPDTHKDLLQEAVFVTLVTVMPDGQPQATVVWCDYDGSHVLVSTARERQKGQNMAARPKATILAIDPENPYRYLEVRGTVEGMTEEGAVALSDKLARQYTDAPGYYGHLAPAEQQEKETRITCKIKPTHVNAVGD